METADVLEGERVVGGEREEDGWVVASWIRFESSSRENSGSSEEFAAVAGGYAGIDSEGGYAGIESE